MIKEHSILKNLTIKYNFWFIKLRYAASLLIPALLFIFGKLFDIKFSTIQIYIILGTAILIFIANEFFRYLHDRFFSIEISEYNPVYFSLIQIIFDFICLGVLLYYTGGSQSPLLYFFLIHLIISAILLPKKLSYMLSGLSLFLIGSYFAAEYVNIVYSQPLMNLVELKKYGDINHYISVGGVFFALAIFIVYSSSKIASDLFKREKELIEAYQKLEESEKEKQNYVRLIIHELKSPIASAKSLLNLVSSDVVTKNDIDKIIDLAKRSENRLDDLLKLINEILRLSKFKLMNEISKEEFNLIKAIYDILEKYKPLIDEKQLNIAVLSSEPEVNILGDKTLIELCLSNLINNAVKYNNQEGSIKINVKRNNEYIETEISDTGIGIKPDEIEKIFVENYRSKDVVRSNIEGSGIGLAIIKQIIEAHGGKIEIYSPSKIAEKNKPGTTVILKLKIYSNEQEQQNDLKKE